MHLNRHFQTNLALGSDVTLTLVSSLSEAKVTGLFSQFWRQVYGFEKQFSRFLPESELSRFNRVAGSKTAITPAFGRLLRAAKAQSLESGGLYNPFILPALQRSGYLHSAAPGYERDVVDDYTTRGVVGADQLEIGDNWAQIPFNTALDLGGCGKGYLAEELRSVVDLPEVAGYWISLGGDIATAGHDETGAGWVVGIQDADDLTGELAWAVFCPEEPFAVATSGTFRRANQSSGATWHHLINPVTERPAETDIRLATVGASSALTADVLASCAVVLGSKAAPAYLKSHHGLSAYLQTSDSDHHFGSFIKTRELTSRETTSNA